MEKSLNIRDPSLILYYEGRAYYNNIKEGIFAKKTLCYS
jgi:hypothetical protein